MQFGRSSFLALCVIGFVGGCDSLASIGDDGENASTEQEEDASVGSGGGKANTSTSTRGSGGSSRSTGSGTSNSSGGNTGSTSGESGGGSATSSGGSSGSGGASSTSGSGGASSGSGGRSGSGGAAGASSGSGGRSGSGGASSGSGGRSGSGGAAGASSGSGGSTGSAGSSGLEPPAAITNGSSGKTTRYWDCCKPSCAWNASGSACDKQDNPISDNSAQSACSGGSAYACWDMAPWSVGTKLSYGYVAAGSSSSDYSCGRCYQFDFKSGAVSGKTMIVQVINDGGDVAQGTFDLLIPGGGVGLYNACTSGSSQWGSVDIGSQYGGILASCSSSSDKSSCVLQKCQSAFGSKADLLAGCQWFVNWFGASDNPTMVYKQITCPDAIKQKSGLSG